jgi:hypothetical protein
MNAWFGPKVPVGLTLAKVCKIRTAVLSESITNSCLGLIVPFKHQLIYSIRDILRLVEEGSIQTFAAVCTNGSTVDLLPF